MIVLLARLAPRRFMRADHFDRLSLRRRNHLSAESGELSVEVSRLCRNRVPHAARRSSTSISLRLGSGSFRV